ncbi:MAG: hypothetical protein ACYC35_05065 [Pirellulales bacterium]
MLFELTLKDAALVVSVAGCLFGLGVWLFRKDDQIESRRKNAIDITAELKAAGLDFACPFFTDYAVGDYSGMFEEARRILARLKDPDERKLALAKLFAKQLEARLRDPDERGKIVKRLQEAAAAPVTN